MNNHTLKQTSEGVLVILEHNGPDFPVMEYETYPVHKPIWNRLYSNKNLEDGVDLILDKDFNLDIIELDENHIQMVACPKEIFTGK